MPSPGEQGTPVDAPGSPVTDGRGARRWRIANAVMLLAFGLGFAVQFNDPDPLAWAAIYALAAGACLFALLGRSTWILSTAVAVVAIVWSVSLAPAVLGRVPFLDMFDAWEMENVGIEESREMYGLLIIAAWMMVLAVRARRTPFTRSPSASPASSGRGPERGR